MHTLREQFLERLLREIFFRKGSGFVLKGGAALRALYGPQRLTKDVDLDFTNPKRTADSLHNTISRSIKAAARGLPINKLTVSVPGKAEKTPRWKVNFEDQDARQYHVEVEISRDPSRAVPGAIVQTPFVPEAATGIARFWVDIYDGPALIASKLAALLGRGLPRDIFDLDILIGMSAAPDTQQIRWAIERAQLHQGNPLEMLRNRMDTLSFSRYQTELQDSLLPAVADRINAKEWTALKRRVLDYVAALLVACSV